MNLKVRAGLGIVVVYTAYSTYLQLRTSYEISERDRKHQYDVDRMTLKSHEIPQSQFAALIVGGRYANPFNQYRPQTLYEFFYCRIIEAFKPKPRAGVPQDLKLLQELLPSRTPDFELLREFTREKAREANAHSLSRVETSEDEKNADITSLGSPSSLLTLTWLGQSCSFVQLAGVNILTDPCLGNHLVHPHIGPKRITPAPCGLDDLPGLDLVLVSHDHPDHLELEAADDIGNSAIWVVPSGVSSHLRARGIDNVTEMTWWDRRPLPGVAASEGWELCCTPAMHWSGRMLYDSNCTLWCSYLILHNGKPVFFHAGDTGYSPELFTGIRKVYGGGCKVMMMPCGAYEPRWHLRSQHTNPSEALQVMKDLEAKKMVGVHWGTFVMSDEHFLEPRDKLHALADEQGRKLDVLAPEFGRTLVFDLNESTEYEASREYIRDGKSLLIK